MLWFESSLYYVDNNEETDLETIEAKLRLLSSKQSNATTILLLLYFYEYCDSCIVHDLLQIESWGIYYSD